MSNDPSPRRRLLKRLALGVLALVVVAVAGAGVFAYSQISAYDASLEQVYAIPLPAVERSTDPAVLARGQHLARSLAGCALGDCHGADLSGGRVTDSGPVGSMAAPNITPAGMAAAYSDAELLRLIRHGVKRDGRGVRFMPAQEFNWLSDADMAAVISYVRSVPPVEKPNAAMTIGALGKILDRQGLIPIDVARRIDHAQIELGPEPSPTVLYGRFIGRLCACHGETLSGGPIPGAPPDFPVPLNITMHETGLKGWTYEDFTQLAMTGRRKNGDKLAAFMPVEALANMDDVERRALWAYLESMPPTPFGNR